MAKKVIIDGVEYVPKSYAPIGVVSGGFMSREYAPLTHGYSGLTFQHPFTTEYTVELTLCTGEKLDVKVDHEQFYAIREAAELCLK